MIELAGLAMLGASLLAFALSGDGNSDPESDAAPETETPEDLAPPPPLRSLSLLTGEETAEAEEEGEVFTVTTPTAQGLGPPAVQGFDPETDLVAFNLSDLMAASTTLEGDAHFSETATPGYTLSIDSNDETGCTTVSLTLFDSADPEVAPVAFDIRLEGITALDDACVSVVDGATGLETLAGGERAAAGGLTGDATASGPVAEESLHRIDTGEGTDRVTGDLRGTRLTTRGGDDFVSVSGTGSMIDTGSGDDTVEISGGPGNFVAAGAGDDDITVDLGTDVSGGTGTDSITVRVPETPQNGVPLFLWNQPVEDARFSAHSTITLDDEFDTVNLALAPDVPGQLHRVTLTQESFGNSSSEVYIHRYTLVVWTPDDVPDLHALVTGPGSAFNSSLALDSEIGAADYENAATDPAAPRVLLTIDHGTDFSGFIDEDTGAVSGAQNGSHDLRLTTNREFASVHDGLLY
jgi:hypothetical protein